MAGQSHSAANSSSSRGLTRRRFLGRAAAAAAPWIAAGTATRTVLGAGPWIVRSSALGRGGATAPSERITLAIIGLKKMGGTHVDSLMRLSEVQIVAVCDVDAAARDAARTKVQAFYAASAHEAGARRGEASRGGEPWRGVAAYNEFERILERTDVDAVVIAVPDHWHESIAIAACRAGKDVYCEKPLSLTVRAGRRMVDAARRYGRVFQTGSQQRSAAEFRRACELVRNGCIGAVRRIHVEVGPCSQHVELAAEPVPEGLDYERWLGPAPWAPFNATRIGSNYFNGWRRIRDYSGGKMTDWGAHHYDIVQWALGMDESGPVEVLPPPQKRATGPLPKIVDGPGVFPDEPSFGLIHRYANGVEVHKDGLSGVEFEGSEGRIVVNRGLLQTTPASLKSVRFTSRDQRLPASSGHYQDWLDCMRTRRRPIADVEIGARSATVCHLGNIALWLGRSIRWDPAREEIVGDEQAARWLDRPKRAPYADAL